MITSSLDVLNAQVFCSSDVDVDGSGNAKEVSFVQQGEGVSQTQLDYISTSLRIHYHLLRNEAKTFTVELTLRNNGNRSIEACCWSIIFYHFSVLHATNIRTESMDRGVFFHDDSLTKPSSPESGFEIIHLNGNTYRMKALRGFQGLTPSAEAKVTLTGQRWIVSRSQVLPKWYVTSDDPSVEPRLLSSTVSERLDFVGRFETPDQILRSAEDTLSPFTPEKRFEMNAAAGKDFGGAPREILPTPLVENFQLLPKELHVVSSGWSVSFAKELENEATYLKGMFKTFHCLHPGWTSEGAI